MCDYFRDYGVDLDRVVLKIPANRGGMKAMSQLEKQGIACCMTTIYTMEQTIASVGKGASLVAPYLGPISDWQKRHKIAGRDLGLELAYDMHAYLKAGGHTAEIVSCPEGVEQVLCLCGIDYLCMDPGTMGALSASNEPPKVASFREKVGARPVSQFESLKNQEDFDAHMKASDLLSEEFPKWIQYFIDGANSLDDYLKSQFG